MKWAGIVLPLVLAGICFRWVPVGLWIDMNQGLLAFLGLLAAALVQIIPVTTNFLQSDFLTPVEAEKLTGQLTKQQQYWIGLLASTIASVALVVVVSVLKGRTEITFWNDYVLDSGPAFSALVGLMLSFVLIKMIGIFQGVISLQKLRTELVLNAAKRNAAAHVATAYAEAELPAAITPKGYGSIVQHH
jgi:hypothetical protein